MNIMKRILKVLYFIIQVILCFLVMMFYLIAGITMSIISILSGKDEQC